MCADTCYARSSGGAQKAQWRDAKQPVREADTDGDISTAASRSELCGPGVRYADAPLMNATQTKWTNSVELVAKRVEHCGEDAVPRSVVIVAY